MLAMGQKEMQGERCSALRWVTWLEETLAENPQASYYRARYYDPVPGRFLSEDPARFDGGVNLYAYVLNNPADYTDPKGLKTSVCCRPLRYIVGKFGFKHCYIRMNIHGGPSHTYGLDREDANGVLYPGGPKAVRDDPTDVGGTCKDVKDATPCNELDLERKFDDPHCPSCGPLYSWWSTNSNFYVPWVLNQVGMTAPPFGGSAPGYNLDPSKF
jgi:RHS repeat-associated protein